MLECVVVTGTSQYFVLTTNFYSFIYLGLYLFNYLFVYLIIFCFLLPEDTWSLSVLWCPGPLTLSICKRCSRIRNPGTERSMRPEWADERVGERVGVTQ